MLKTLARSILRFSGWKMIGEVPDLDKAVFIAAPHTSNWDGFWFLVYKVAIEVKVSFLAKKSLFWWPLGNLLRSFGAIPVDRSDATTIVPQLVQTFAEADHLFLALAPEGTRKWQPHWKTGFYRIAKAADVPIVLAFIDYRNKEIGVGPTLPRNHGMREDRDAISEFYSRFTGKRPELQGPVTFGTHP